MTADARQISGYATLDVTRTCAKATADKTREIATARSAHVIELGADLSESPSGHVDQAYLSLRQKWSFSAVGGSGRTSARTKPAIMVAGLS